MMTTTTNKICIFYRIL